MSIVESSRFALSHNVRPNEFTLECRVLKDLVQEEKEKRTFASLGAIELVIEHMRNFGSNEPINMFGIAVLGNLAFGNDDNRARIGQKGGIDCILDGMESFIKKSELQGVSCVALTNIAHSDDNNKRIIVKKGGIEKILDVMQEYVDNFELQVSGSVWCLLCCMCV